MNGSPRNRLARLHPNGSLDKSFVPFATGWADVDLGFRFAFVIQRDGKVIVWGRFLMQGAAKPLLLVRLNSDGSLDDDFHAEPRSLRFAENEVEDLSVRSVALQPNEDFLVAIQFRVRGGPIETQPIRMYGDGFPYLWPHAFQRNADGTTELQITASTNRTVVVEAAADLKAPQWHAVATLPAGAGQRIMTVNDSDAVAFPQRFYRAVR